MQAAIWFFTDRYVLRTDDPLHAAVQAIVTAVISAGAVPQPQAPTLTITPASGEGPVGQTIGPFTVTSSVAATVTATGATMWTAASGGQQIADGASLPSGTTQIWLKSTGTAATATLSAQATATVPSGNVYLYSGNNPNVTSAQKLILAESATLKTTVSAEADFTGSLEADKTIAGQSGGNQGAITISVNCDKGPSNLPAFNIPAGTAKGPLPRRTPGFRSAPPAPSPRPPTAAPTRSRSR